MGRTGCSVPRVCAMQRKFPGGFGNRPSATTGGREELTGGEAFALHHRAGSRPTIAAVERRKASVPGAQAGRKFCLRGTQGAPNGSAVTRDLCACGPASLVRKRVPLHPKRLSALRFPHSLMRERQN